MTCAEVREALTERALGAEPTRSIEDHLARCADCAREAEEISAAADLLRSYSVPAPPPGLTSAAWRRAMAALPAHAAPGWRALAWPLVAAFAALPLVIAYNMLALSALLSLSALLPMPLVYYLAGSYLALTLLALGASYGAVPILVFRTTAAKEAPLHG